MKIIDAHLHLFRSPSGDEESRSVGHINSTDHLRQVYGELNIVHGVVMGNHSLALDYHDYPPDLFHYCLGLDSSLTDSADLSSLPDITEAHLRRESCCGIKLYPGYSRIPLTDPLYGPVYELAARYKKPVAVHMGQTAGSKAYIKYSHPLTMDEAAVRHPDVQFVMCHFGNPWLMDAAAVVEKNENVAADLSGLLEGKVDFTALLKKQRGYLEILKSWIGYCDAPEKFMFGTDWPLANYGDYIEFVKWLIPETQWEQVFYKTAANVYRIG